LERRRVVAIDEITAGDCEIHERHNVESPYARVDSAM
jgi:hypothetical protein